MARFFSAAGREVLTLETATARGLTWDVFVSHTTKDDELAEMVAKRVRSHGLTAWVDSDYMAPHQDGPGMASKIGQVIGRSYCLLAIVTSATSASWWVPFEIGIASDRNRFLSTYGSPTVPLPSFLAAWPRVRGHDELPPWCELVKQKMATYSSVTHRGYVEAAGLQGSDYAREMRQIARRFPGVR